MIRAALAALIGLVLVLVVSLLLASIIGLGPEEFWILPTVLLASAALTTRRHLKKQRARR